MITATVNGKVVKVNGLCNKGETLGEPWLITIPIGIGVLRYISIAPNEQDAMDIYADSIHGVLTKVEKVTSEEDGYYCALGNYGDYHDLSSMTKDCISQCTSVDYFAKPISSL